jgi:hypothetical protein
MHEDDDVHDGEFVALIGEVDSYDAVVSAAVGAARDLTRDLEAILLELEDVLYELSAEQPPGCREETDEGRLEIVMANAAFAKLDQISNALDAVEDRRGL